MTSKVATAMVSTARWRLLAAAATMVAITACGGGGSGGESSGTVAPPAPAEYPNFSTFTEQIYAAAPNSMPVDVTNLVINYDVNDDPTVFNYLLMM